MDLVNNNQMLVEYKSREYKLEYKLSLPFFVGFYKSKNNSFMFKIVDMPKCRQLKDLPQAYSE